MQRISIKFQEYLIQQNEALATKATLDRPPQKSLDEWTFSEGLPTAVALEMQLHLPRAVATSLNYSHAYACAQSLHHVHLFATLQTMAHQAPLSMRFFRQKYWSGLPFLSPGDLPDPGIESASPALSGRFFTLKYLLLGFTKLDAWVFCQYLFPCIQ